MRGSTLILIFLLWSFDLANVTETEIMLYITDLYKPDIFTVAEFNKEVELTKIRMKNYWCISSYSSRDQQNRITNRERILNIDSQTGTKVNNYAILMPWDIDTCTETMACVPSSLVFFLTSCLRLWLVWAKRKASVLAGKILIRISILRQREICNFGFSI